MDTAEEIRRCLLMRAFIASDFGQSFQYAANCRLRYLESTDYGEPQTLTEAALIDKWLLADIDEIHKIKLRLSALRKPKERDEITDEMIERARNYPVDRLIEFRRGTATAWCHEDKHPSLKHMARTNTAWCPPCDRYFDSIGVLRERDGLSFRDAVKQLQC